MSYQHSIRQLAGAPQLALAVLLVATAACAPQGSQPSSALETLGEQWEAALNAGDVNAIAAFYTEDCRLMPPNGELEIGRLGAPVRRMSKRLFTRAMHPMALPSSLWPRRTTATAVWPRYATR